MKRLIDELLVERRRPGEDLRRASESHSLGRIEREREREMKERRTLSVGLGCASE
jgi:hypothetical protein